MTQQPLPLDVSFFVELYLDDRILGGMDFDTRGRFTDLLHAEGAIETCDYSGITVNFNHGDEAKARATVQRALDRLT